MDRNFWIPFTIIAVLSAVMALSGLYPVAFVVMLFLFFLLIVFIGVRTGGDRGRMMLWGIPLALVMILLALGLGLLMKYIPWLRVVFLWPLKP